MYSSGSMSSRSQLAGISISPVDSPRCTGFIHSAAGRV
jgi:hypothetical protein